MVGDHGGECAGGCTTLYGPHGPDEERSAVHAINAMTLHEKQGVPPHLAVTLANAGVEPNPDLRDELMREIDDQESSR